MNTKKELWRHFVASFFLSLSADTKNTLKEIFGGRKKKNFYKKNISNNTCDRLIHIKHKDDKNQEPTKRIRVSI